MNKRRIIINRKKQLRSYFSHLWVVSKISRQDFRKNFLLGDLPCGEEDSAYRVLLNLYLVMSQFYFQIGSYNAYRFV